MAQEANGERFERGMKVLQRIGGEGFDLPIKRLAEASPDLARFTVEYPYGDILSRPGLNLPLRQICTVSCLMALGSVQPQLKFHMTGFLNAGGRPQDLVELLFVSVAVLGFPPPSTRSPWRARSSRSDASPSRPRHRQATTERSDTGAA